MFSNFQKKQDFQLWMTAQVTKTKSTKEIENTTPCTRQQTKAKAYKLTITRALIKRKTIIIAKAYKPSTADTHQIIPNNRKINYKLETRD